MIELNLLLRMIYLRLIVYGRALLRRRAGRRHEDRHWPPDPDPVHPEC